MKRQRGRNRRPGGGGGGGGGGGHHHQNNNPNRSLESSGPEGGKVRGPAALIYERYLQAARDAASSGDRVLSENYLQHADHYFRLVRSMQPAQPAPQPQDRFNDQDQDGDEEGAPENDRAEGVEASAEGDEQPDVEFPQGDRPQSEREGGGRRRRRSRFRPDGEGAEAREGGDQREGSESRDSGEQRRERRPDRAEGEGREPRRERAPRERTEEPAGPEGFSNGPKPAFLRSGE